MKTAHAQIASEIQTALRAAVASGELAALAGYRVSVTGSQPMRGGGSGLVVYRIRIAGSSAGRGAPWLAAERWAEARFGDGCERRNFEARMVAA